MADQHGCIVKGILFNEEDNGSLARRRKNENWRTKKKVFFPGEDYCLTAIFPFSLLNSRFWIDGVLLDAKMRTKSDGILNTLQPGRLHFNIWVPPKGNENWVSEPDWISNPILTMNINQITLIGCD